MLFTRTNVLLVTRYLLNRHLQWCKKHHPNLIETYPLLVNIQKYIFSIYIQIYACKCKYLKYTDPNSFMLNAWLRNILFTKKKQLKSKMSAHKTVAYKQQGSLYAMKLHWLEYKMEKLDLDINSMPNTRIRMTCFRH